jgi:hypothetical protein
MSGVRNSGWVCPDCGAWLWNPALQYIHQGSKSCRERQEKIQRLPPLPRASQ